MTARICVALAAAMLVVGCGSDDEKAGTGAAAKPAAAGGPAPASLLGTYTTTLTKRDLARNGAAELQESPEWELVVANTGGSGSGRILTLKNKTAGALEAPDFSVSGDRIVLTKEECAAGGSPHFYDNEYSFKQAGKTLRFTKVRNSCSDRVAETILTSEPWTRKGG
ncbi:MAG: hypothetical protein QOH76_2314 [Thermoleophilaceae bacterium]|nr:hypothetical protein [Thermoleophilaceae bacterium]